MYTWGFVHVPSFPQVKIIVLPSVCIVPGDSAPLQLGDHIEQSKCDLWQL